MSERMEFGVPRTHCNCEVCTNNCRVMPGYLIPADLDRLTPAGADPFRWAESNLLASPGALVAKNGQMFRIPTLVPATKEDKSCTHLTAEGACGIHDVAPFGCAFFDCGPERPEINHKALAGIYKACQEQALYFQLHVHLSYKGLVQERAEVLRSRMQ